VIIGAPSLASIHPVIAWFWIIVGILLIIDIVRKLLRLRKEQKLLLSDPEVFIENKRLHNEQNVRPLFWFNRL